MKKLIYLLLIASPLLATAQRSSIGASGGYTTNGFGSIVEYNHHFAEYSAINSSLYYSYANSKSDVLGDEIKINYSNITINVGYYYKAHNASEGRFRVLLGGGGVIGYEIINNGSDTLDNGVGIAGESQVIYGGYVGTNLNYFISQNFALSLVLNEFYHLNSDLGNFGFYGGFGIKYYVF